LLLRSGTAGGWLLMLSSRLRVEHQIRHHSTDHQNECTYQNRTFAHDPSLLKKMLNAEC
jgi:hypothetical protein